MRQIAYLRPSKRQKRFSMRVPAPTEDYFRLPTFFLPIFEPESSAGEAADEISNVDDWYDATMLEVDIWTYSNDSQRVIPNECGVSTFVGFWTDGTLSPDNKYGSLMMSGLRRQLQRQVCRADKPCDTLLYKTLSKEMCQWANLESPKLEHPATKNVLNVPSVSTKLFWEKYIPQLIVSSVKLSPSFTGEKDSSRIYLVSTFSILLSQNSVRKQKKPRLKSGGDKFKGYVLVGSIKLPLTELCNIPSKIVRAYSEKRGEM